MDKRWKTLVGVLCCGVISTVPFTAYADTYDGMEQQAAGAEHVELIPEASPLAATDFVIKAEESSGRVYNRTEEAKAEAEAKKLKVEQEALEDAVLTAAQTAAADVKAQENTNVRQKVVDYALTFLGGPYRYGGSDPRTGVDCSGFTRFVLGNAAGVQLPRSSGSQATQGVAVSADQMQPGDLLFYADRGGINHVAMYIGSGQVVHASTYETGIKVSPWNYRNPVRIVNVIG